MVRIRVIMGNIIGIIGVIIGSIIGILVGVAICVVALVLAMIAVVELGVVECSICLYDFTSSRSASLGTGNDVYMRLVCMYVYATHWRWWQW